MDLTLCRVLKDGEEWWMEKSEYTKLGTHKRSVIPRAREIAREHEPCVLEILTTDRRRVVVKAVYPSDLASRVSLEDYLLDLDRRRTRY